MAAPAINFTPDAAPAISFTPDLPSGTTDFEDDDSPEAAEAKALAGGAEAVTHYGTGVAGGALAAGVYLGSGGNKEEAQEAQNAVTYTPRTTQGQGAVQAINQGASAAAGAVGDAANATPYDPRTGQRVANPTELEEKKRDPYGLESTLLPDIGQRANIVAQALPMFAGARVGEAAEAAAAADVASTPASMSGFTRAEFAPQPPKPKITPAAGESAQAAAERQGLAPSPQATAPATAAPSAAPGPHGNLPATVHDPEFFRAPDNQGLKSGTVPPAEQALRQAAVERGAPTLPQVRESAITNNYADQGRDWTGKQSGDPVATAQVAAEGQALHTEAGRISQETGGQQGTGESADAVRGRAYQDWHDTTASALDDHIKQAYAAEDAKAKTLASPASNLKGVLTDDSLIDNANAGAVRSSTIALGKKMGVDLTDPNAQLNGYQIENLRKHANATYGSAPRLAQAIKNAADADLPAGAYVQARKLKQLKSDMFDNRDGINQLGPSTDINPATGTPRPENRPVKAPDVMSKIEGFSPDQTAHIVRTMKRSSSVFEALGDHGTAMKVADKAYTAAQHLQSHFTSRWADEAGKGGGWNQRRANQYLRGNQESLASVFSPEQMHQIRNVNGAANVLDMDKGYKGAFAQFQSGSRWRRELGKRAAGLVEGAATGWMGPVGGAVSEATGIGPAIRGGVERAVGGGAGPPKGFTRPLGQRVPGQGGWVGDRPEPGDVEGLGKNYPVLNHEYDKETGEHQVHSPGGGLTVADDVGPHIRVLRDDTPEDYQRQGHSVARQAKLVDTAAARGGRLQSDYSISPAEAAVYEKMKARGFDVQKNPNTVVNPGTGNIIDNSGSRTPVYSVGPKPVTDTRPLGQRIGGGTMRGGPKWNGKNLNEHPAVESVSDERHEGNGVWAYLKKGFQYNGDNGPSGQIHEDTHAAVARELKKVGPGEGAQPSGAEDNKALSDLAKELDARPLGQRIPGQRGGPGKKTGPSIIERLNGETPMRMYHGSLDLRHGAAIGAGGNRPMWMAFDKDLADQYGAGRGGQTHAFDVSVKNPANLTELAHKLLPIYNKDKYLHSVNPDARWNPKEDGDIKDNAYLLANSPDVMDELRRRGHDSVLVDEYPGDPNKRYSLGILDPSQAKWASEKGQSPATVNVGLHQGTEGRPGFRKMSKQEAVKALESTGAKVGKTTVLTPEKHGVAEPTLVADTDRALNPDEMQGVLARTKQSAIPQQVHGGEGEMHVAPGHEAIAKEQGWDQFSSDHFREHNGKTQTENATSFNPEELEKENFTPHPAQTVTNPVRNAYPGIYDKVKDIMSRVKTEPEDPIMKQLFGKTRKDLHDDALAHANVEQDYRPPGVAAKAKGSKAAKNVMTDENAARLRDTISAFKESHPEAYHGMVGWYEMQALYDKVKQHVGAKLAPAVYDRLNHLIGMSSSGSDVVTEINRGTGANMMHAQGKFDQFAKHGGTPEAKRGKNFPPELEDVKGHAYHSTAHVKPMQHFLNTGESQMESPKVPTYIRSSAAQGQGFQNRVLVGDSHWSRGVGLADTRTAEGRVNKQGVFIKGYNKSVSNPELSDLHPWYRSQVADKVGLPATSAQAVQWGALSHETGVNTAIGAPKLEIFAQQVAKAAKRMNVTPEEALKRIIKGMAHAG